MNKTIKIKVTNPPAGVRGRSNPFAKQSGSEVDGYIWKVFENVLPEATCLHVSKDGVVIAIATIEEGEKKYNSIIVPTLFTQQYDLGDFSKNLIESGYEDQAQYVDGILAEFIFSEEPKPQSVYAKAATKISEDLSKALANDENSVIEFSYQVEFGKDPIFSTYATSNGTFKVREQKYFNATKPVPGMDQIFKSLFNASAARQALPGKDAGEVTDGSFISFWGDIPQGASGVNYTSEGLNEMLNEGVNELSQIQEKQREQWAQLYESGPGPA